MSICSFPFDHWKNSGVCVWFLSFFLSTSSRARKGGGNEAKEELKSGGLSIKGQKKKVCNAVSTTPTLRKNYKKWWKMQPVICFLSSLGTDLP